MLVKKLIHKYILNPLESLVKLIYAKFITFCGISMYLFQITLANIKYGISYSVNLVQLFLNFISVSSTKYKIYGTKSAVVTKSIKKKQSSPTYQQLLDDVREAYEGEINITDHGITVGFFGLEPTSEISLLLSLFNHPSCTITSLHINDNLIEYESAIILATALQSEHCNLTSLHLYHNYIEDKSAIALANALHNPNCTLTSLDIQNNKIGDEGAIALANALPDVPLLQTLSLYGNDNIGSAGRAALDPLFRSHFSSCGYHQYHNRI